LSAQSVHERKVGELRCLQPSTLGRLDEKCQITHNDAAVKHMISFKNIKS